MQNNMSVYQNYGVVSNQKFIEEFQWNNKLFYCYLVQFNEYDGFFKLVRESRHEQALIGAKMMFNYSNEKGQIDGYRIISYEPINKDERIKELLIKRKQQEQNRKK